MGNSSQLIRRTREILDAGESNSTGPWSDSVLLRYINDALREIHAQQITKSPERYLGAAALSAIGTSPVLVGNGKYLVDLPEYVATPIALESGTDRFVSFSSSLRDARSGVSSANNQGYRQGEITVQMVRNGSLMFRGTSSPDLSAFVLYYIHRPADLARFKVETASSSTTTFQVRTTEVTSTGSVAYNEPLGSGSWINSYYVGAKVEVSYAKGGSPEKEVRRVTNYATGTYPYATFTVGTAFSAAVPAGAVVDMIPELDPLFHEIPCYQAASRALESVGHFDHMMAVDRRAEKLREQWTNSFAMQQQWEGPRLFVEQRR